MMPGFAELAILLVIILIFFGAGKLPEVFRSMGEGIKQFRDAQEGTTDDASDVTPSPKQISSDGVSEAEEVSQTDKARAE